MKEEWRPIPISLCQGYEASSLGRIRSLDKTLTIRNKKGNVYNQFFKGKILKFSANKRYFIFKTVSEDKKYWWGVHRIICLTFNGKKPTNEHQVAHLDGNPHNNNYKNLKWVLAKENISHRISHGTMHYGENCHNAKLKNDDIKRILKLREKGFSVRQISRVFGIAFPSVSRIARGKIWKEAYKRAVKVL